MSWQGRLRAVIGAVGRALWRYPLRPVQRPLRRIARFFAVRFADVSSAEAWGYAIWGLVGAAVAVPEIWAAAAGSDFVWPTISGTVGHLEDKWTIVALAPVALLAGAALALGHFQSGVTIQADGQALIRTPEGRVAKAGKVDLGAPEVPEIVLDPSLALKGRSTFPVFPYFFWSTLLVIVASLAASASKDKWLTGYVLYALLGLLGMVIPNALAYWKKRDVPFTTLFFTVRTLERRLHLVSFVISAGLAILLIHLALYPWPDLARDSASHAGLNPSKAREKATAELKASGWRSPNYSTERRDVRDGRNVWLVYYLDKSNHYSGCVVAVTKSTTHIPPGRCHD